MVAFTTYSFLDVSATITGPNITASIGSTSGTSDEGITVAFSEDQSTMVTGADGTGMHSIHGAQSGTVNLRLLKSSPTNALLAAAYQADRSVPSSGGQNTIVISWLAGGDVYLCSQCDFRKFPDNAYGKDANIIEWTFNAIYLNPLLGSGQ